jgi:hypothetical protein
VVQYFKEMIDDLVRRIDILELREGVESRFQTICEELERLDPRDFQPARRAEFVNLRRVLGNLRQLKSNDWSYIQALASSTVRASNDPIKLTTILRRVELYGARREPLEPDYQAHQNLATDVITCEPRVFRLPWTRHFRALNGVAAEPGACQGGPPRRAQRGEGRKGEGGCRNA